MEKHLTRILLSLFLLVVAGRSLAQPSMDDGLNRPFDFDLLLSASYGELRSNHFHAGLDFKTGGVVGIKVVNGEEDLLLVTQSGILIRTAVENIRETGRATQGVIVMRFKEEGDQVISLALTEKDEEMQNAE